MTQITLRGIDPDIEKEIREKARRSGKSLNRVVLDLLRKNTEQEKKNLPRAESLKKLAGGWDREDAAQFMESMEMFETIDEAMWK